MNGKRLLGVLLLVVGVALLVMGVKASDSIGDQFSQVFRGRFTDRTTLYIIGGVAIALLGLCMAMFGGRRRSRLLS